MTASASGRIAIAALGVGLAGCATAPFGGQGQTNAPPVATDGLLFTALAESGLPERSCGMVLWTLDVDRPTPILRQIAGGAAEAAVNGAPTTFDLVSSGGPSVFGVSEEQVFRSASGWTVTTRVAFGLAFDGGVYLERSLVTIETADGWRTVTPAAGIAGCRR